MCRSIRLPRQQPSKGETNRFSGGSSHQALPEAKSLRRDDGSGQAVARVVDASNDAITPSADWPTCSSMNPIRRRPRADPGQKQVPGERMTQKGIDSSRPVTEASCAHIGSEYAHEYSQRRHRNHPAIPHAMVYGLYRALVSAKSARMCERAALTNRPPLDLSPWCSKALEPDGERGTDPVSSSTRTVAWA
jgi:hypothetical protein